MELAGYTRGRETTRIMRGSQTSSINIGLSNLAFPNIRLDELLQNLRKKAACSFKYFDLSMPKGHNLNFEEISNSGSHDAM